VGTCGRVCSTEVVALEPTRLHEAALTPWT
jgi:hypothetical protein